MANNSKWDTHVRPNLLKIAQLKKQGMNDLDIAENIGVSHTTFTKYKMEKKELKEALTYEKLVDIEKAEKALFNRFKGKYVTEVKEEYDGDGNLIKRTNHRKYINGSDTAIIFALKNLCPERWSDTVKNDINIEKTPEINLILEDFKDKIK